MPHARSPPPRITKPAEPPKPIPPLVPTATETVAAAESSLTGRKVIGKRESQEENDHQRFVITPACPACTGVLVPERGIYCQNCGHPLPPEIAVHREVVVSIVIEDYGRLAKFLIQKVNRALGNLIRGTEIAEGRDMHGAENSSRHNSG